MEEGKAQSLTRPIWPLAGCIYPYFMFTCSSLIMGVFYPWAFLCITEMPERSCTPWVTESKVVLCAERWTQNSLLALILPGLKDQSSRLGIISKGCFLFSLVRIETVWKHILDRGIAPKMLRALLSWAYKESKENLGLSVLGCTDLDQKLLLTHSSSAKHRSVKGALLVHSQHGHGLDRERMD